MNLEEIAEPEKLEKMGSVLINEQQLPWYERIKVALIFFVSMISL